MALVEDARGLRSAVNFRFILTVDTRTAEHMPHVSSAFIVGTDGVIVWETGNSLDDARRHKAEIRKVTDKPIKAVMYSHSHDVLGTTILLTTFPPKIDKN